MLEKRKILRQLKKYEAVIIYGAGGVGKTVASWLTSEGREIRCFAVSDKKKNQDNVDGIPVCQIDELCQLKESAIVIVATLENLHADIGKTLDKYGFTNRIYTTKRLLDSIGIIEVNGYFPEKHASIYRGINKAAHAFFKDFKCKNVLMFESRIDYTDNCRALSEYIEEHLPEKYKLVWIMNNPENMKKRPDIIRVSRDKMSLVGIIRFNYYLARAKYIFFTNPWWLHEWKKEQMVVNLGHGNPLKSAAGLIAAHSADCGLASSEDGVKYRKKEYQDDVDIIVLGPPRNDWLFEKEKEILHCYTEGKCYKKIIFCLPTMKQYQASFGKLKKVMYDSRIEYRFCINTIDSVEKLNELNALLQEENVLLICKEHHMQKKMAHTDTSHIKYIDNEMLRRNGHDIYQLMAHADALITDFSSIYMDYLLLDRPIGFFYNSFEQYDRGFTMDNPQDYMPGKKIYNNLDLEEFIRSVVTGTDDFAEERKVTRDLVFKYQDNHNCKRCVEYFGL